MALVVIHGHDEIEFAAQGADKDGVGRVRAGAIDAERASFCDGGSDDFGVLPAEEAVLAGMRIEAANGDARRAAAHPVQRVVAELDGANDARAVEMAGLLERNMRADVNGCQLLRVEQHARLRRAGKLGNVFGVAGEGAAGERDGLLVERRGDHGVGFAAHAELDGAANIGDGGERRIRREAGRRQCV